MSESRVSVVGEPASTGHDHQPGHAGATDPAPGVRPDGHLPLGAGRHGPARVHVGEHGEAPGLQRDRLGVGQHRAVAEVQGGQFVGQVPQAGAGQARHQVDLPDPEAPGTRMPVPPASSAPA